MAKFRKKPVVVEAEQWFPGKLKGIVLQPNDLGAPLRWWDEWGHCNPFCGEQIGWIGTLEGGHVVTSGDWIIQGARGELYPCKDEIFVKTYEPVGGDA